MGLNILKTHTSLLSHQIHLPQRNPPLFFSLLAHPPLTSTTRITSRLPSSSSSSSLKPLRLTRSISFSSSGPHFHDNNRSFRGGVVLAMASPGSVEKSEEWRAKQFRILRQKGTEYGIDVLGCLTGIQARENLTGSLQKLSTTVLDVGLR